MRSTSPPFFRSHATALACPNTTPSAIAGLRPVAAPSVVSASTPTASILPGRLRYTHSCVKASRNRLYKCHWQIAFLQSQTDSDRLTHSYKHHGTPGLSRGFRLPKRRDPIAGRALLAFTALKTRETRAKTESPPSSSVTDPFQRNNRGLDVSLSNLMPAPEQPGIQAIRNCRPPSPFHSRPDDHRHTP